MWKRESVQTGSSLKRHTGNGGTNEIVRLQNNLYSRHQHKNKQISE